MKNNLNEEGQESIDLCKEKWECPFCGEDKGSKRKMTAHKRFCKKNPEYEKNMAVHKELVCRKGCFAAREKNKMLYEQNPLNVVNEYTLVCPKCGKNFNRSIKLRDYQKGEYPKYCSSVCAHSRTFSEESIKKKRESQYKFLASVGYTLKTGKNYKGSSYNGKVYKKTKVSKNDKRMGSDVLLSRVCSHCGKPIFVKNTSDEVYCYECADELGLKRILLYTEEGKIYRSKSYCETMKNVAQERVKNGTHKGWTSRNIVSYPEKFWKGVLENNGIKYKFNAPIPKKLLGVENSGGFYFLDFLIGGNIDLEIDGKQHGYDERIKSDIIRDELLTKNGFIVYRIAWNEIVSPEGSALMKEKIDRFLKWLNENDKEKSYTIDYEVPTKFTYHCAICGKEVKTNKKNKNKQFYCSHECAIRWREVKE